MQWLDEPPAGTRVCGGFDGSMVSDYTAIKLETVDGLLFTPRYGPDRRPTIWNPDEWGGNIPREQVHVAWQEIDKRYKLERVYCDPPKFETEIEMWDGLYGPEVFIGWPTYREKPMYAAIDRFVTDLTTRSFRHDGCPITALHVANARKVANRADRYILGKPSLTQKIDAAVTSVLAHEAACDARAAGWGKSKPRKNRRMIVIR